MLRSRLFVSPTLIIVAGLVQYIRPEILGSFLAACAFRDLRIRVGSAPWFVFLLGAVMMLPTVALERYLVNIRRMFSGRSYE